ncbi:MAG: serine O-acetyltransferase [Ruminococcus sp.]|nr:serine O-acetyltransferase [Ruminococcus sp.]
MDFFNKIVRLVQEEVQSVKEKDPAAKTTLEILVNYSGLHAVLFHRVAHWLYERKLFFLARIVSQVSRFITGIEIHPGAKIGKGLLIDHGSGVVIGETAEVGDNCLIYQGVTLGGTGKERGKRHPTLGNNVMVGAGARILGPFKVGDNAKIAANAVVLEEVPPNATAVGVPAKIVRIEGKRVQDLDQVHIPDPISQELRSQRTKIEKLEAELERLKATQGEDK